ncbi:MAG: M67 family metallopeptidase [Planctomycetes bacterium]|nr:M67 family metallopeptidase [Planctomycetota bacterium]
MPVDYKLIVPQDFYRQMLEQARAELPNECCGLLAGKIVEEPGKPPLGWVSAWYPLVNDKASPVEYLSEPRSMAKAWLDMKRRGLEIIAIYHSHPTSDPTPSRKDRDLNYDPQVMNLIISLKDGEPRMAGWWLTADTHREAEWQLSE